MKKTLITLLIICLAAVIPNGVFADEYDQDDDASQSVELYAEVSSTYTVKLPQNVDVTNEEVTFDVQALGDITSAKKLNVAFDASASLVDQSGKSSKREAIALTIENGTNNFTFNELGAEYSDDVKATVTVKHTGVTIPAGTWSVDLPVTISLIDA